MKKQKLFPLFFFFLVFSFIACEEKDEYGSIEVHFNHLIENEEIIFDSMGYINEANNLYLVTEIKWFVSRVCLFKDGEKIEISENDGIHYIDTKLENTLKWKINQEIAVGDYDSLQFIFGFNEKDNISNRFVNHPETSMAWPRHLGGGFHYMMINGKFTRNDEAVSSMNVHMGIGQIYEGTTYSVDSIKSSVHNHFTVTLRQPFNVEKNKTRTIVINMNVENWFKNPHTYDHNYWGSHIMQKQDAMHMLKENGWNVFDMKIK